MSALFELIAKIATETLEAYSNNQKKFRAQTPGLPAEASSLKMQGRQIAEDLVRQAFSSGLQLSAVNITEKKLKGGNTAEFVGEITVKAPFVFKLDSESKKLAVEALAIQQIKNNQQLSQRYRDAWPTIYAVRSITPFAYLMEYFTKEDGWESLEDRLYGGKASVSKASAGRFINAVLDIMFEGFGDSLNKRQLPNITEDYFMRIKERLEETEKKDQRFASRPININGKTLKPWREYLQVIEKKIDYLDIITPSFTTVVHGDPNPGNLMMKVSPSNISLKMIDPKEWITGDYLFDICKITHFIEGTGPVEKPEGGHDAQVKFETNESGTTLSYTIKQPEWTDTVVGACRDRVNDFAQRHGDVNWEERYELGMASNLLGLPIGRLKKGRSDAALMLYGEGLKWLDKFCERLSK